MSNSELPIARKEGLVVQELNDEVLVYDLNTHKAHCLNESASLIWKNCDGLKSIPEIAREFIGTTGNKVDDDFVWLAIDQLNELNLLEKEIQPKFKGQSRREVLRRVGIAAVIALPIVSSLVAPRNAYASVSCGTVTCVVGNPPTCPVACSVCSGSMGATVICIPL